MDTPYGVSGKGFAPLTIGEFGMGDRIPLPEEPIADIDAIIQYDKGARYYMMPEYKYFVGKILKKGIRSGRVLGRGCGWLSVRCCSSFSCLV